MAFARQKEFERDRFEADRRAFEARRRVYLDYVNFIRPGFQTIDASQNFEGVFTDALEALGLN